MPSSIAILVILLVLICTGTYVQYATTAISPHRYVSGIPQKAVHLPPVPPTVIPDACKNVDFQWLGSDRRFWDGWVSKAMFMRKDGKFTRKNVRIKKGETLCVAVLLGPIPAVSSIKATLHYAPSDSIVMTARGEDGTVIPITLKQHDKQTNAYYAAVKFNVQDKYSLETSVEYRSYFWEQPQFHPYLPNRFSSHNILTVSPIEYQTNVCDLLRNPSQLQQSAWIDRHHYQAMDPIAYQQNPFNHLEPVFVPACQLQSAENLPDVLGKKVIHVWGQEHVQKNLQYLNGDNGCNDDEDQHQLPSAVQGAAIFYGENSSTQPRANIVLLGTGNQGSRQTPNEFAADFGALLNRLTQQVYTRDELIIVKTNKYLGSGIADGVTAGKSLAYANIIRSAVAELNQTRVVLWDTHQIGSDQVCLVTHVENAILLNIIQQAAVI